MGLTVVFGGSLQLFGAGGTVHAGLHSHNVYPQHRTCSNTTVTEASVSISVSVNVNLHLEKSIVNYTAVGLLA